MKKSDAVRLFHEVSRLNRCLTDADSPVRIRCSIDSDIADPLNQIMVLSFLVDDVPAVTHIHALDVTK